MRCWNCGGQISRDMQYCELCGADMEKTQSYSQTEIEKTMKKEQKEDKVSTLAKERPGKNRINLEFEKKAETGIVEKTSFSHGSIIHKKRIKKPAFEFLLMLSLLISVLYIIVVVISNGELLEEEIIDNPFLSHVVGMLAAIIITVCGIYVHQEGFLLAGSVIFIISSLFYLPSAWCGWICAGLCFASYHMRSCSRKKILRKKRIDSRTK